MATIQRRERPDASGKIRVTYRVRWWDPDKKQRSKVFTRLREAERFRDTVAADMIRGQYIDPDGGKILFESYAKEWLKHQTFDELTREAVEVRLRLHAFPVLGGMWLKDIKPSTIQAWLRGLKDLANSYQMVIYANVSTIFAAAVDNELIVKNPCRASSVNRPKPRHHKVIPWTADRLRSVRTELPERFALAAVLGAGLGMRQGEIFGLAVEDIDFLRGRVEVRRQIKVFGGNKLVFALPKGRKTRRIPLPESVRDAIATHLTLHPARSVTLPWDTLDGAPRSVELLLSTRESGALNRNYFNPKIWKPALVRAGVEPTRENGMHALRHFYASTLLDAGESIKALSEYLGHADPGFTLRVYTHLMPTSDERTKSAVDGALCGPDVTPGHGDDANAQVTAG